MAGVKIPKPTQKMMEAKKNGHESSADLSKIPAQYMIPYTNGNNITLVRTRDSVNFMYCFIYDLIAEVLESIKQKKTPANLNVIFNYIEQTRMFTFCLLKEGVIRAIVDNPSLLPDAASSVLDEMRSKLNSREGNNEVFLQNYNATNSRNVFTGQYALIFDYLMGYEYLSGTPVAQPIVNGYPGTRVLFNIFAPEFMGDIPMNILSNRIDNYHFLHALRTAGGECDESMYGFELKPEEASYCLFLDPNFVQLPTALLSKMNMYSHRPDGRAVDYIYQVNNSKSKTHPIKLVSDIHKPTFLEANTFLHRSISLGESPKELMSSYYRSVSKRSKAITHIPTENAHHLGGLDLFKRKVEIYENYFASESEKKRGRTILLVGVQGAGKTMAATYAAQTLGRDLYRFDVSRVLGSLQGMSEQNMDAELSMLESLGDVVILMDEIEKTFGGVVSSHATDGGVLLRLMEKIMYFLEKQNSNIFLIMTANSIKNLPPELSRSGRVDSIMFVDFPSEEELEEIVEIHCNETLEGRLKLSSSEVQKISKMLLGRCFYNGADVRDLFRYIFDMCLLEKREPKYEDIVDAFINVQPNYEKHKEKIDETREMAMRFYEPASSKTDSYKEYRKNILENLNKRSSSITDPRLKKQFEVSLGRKGSGSGDSQSVSLL